MSVFSPETDIYALGATFFNLLTGLTPPSASDVYEDGIPVKELESKGVSRKAISVVCQAMAGRKKDRLKSAQAFINALSKYSVKDKDTTVIVVPEKHGIKKWKMWIGIGIMAVAVAVIGIGFELISDYNDNYITVNGKRYKQLPQKTITVNGVSFDMIWVEAGTFMMGSDTGPIEIIDMKPVHKVTLTKNYYIGKTEVTQALWEAVMGENHITSKYKGAYKPIYDITWNDCVSFLSKLNTLTDLNFRLPTEAEWEYAARGGNRSCNYRYSGSDYADEVAWFHFNDTIHVVATKKPNELGIYDMTGNVGELCSDWYDENYYRQSPQIDPTGPSNGEYHVVRGNVLYIEDGFSMASRIKWPDDILGYESTGIRLVLDE